MLYKIMKAMKRHYMSLSKYKSEVMEYNQQSQVKKQIKYSVFSRQCAYVCQRVLWVLEVCMGQG